MGVLKAKVGGAWVPVGQGWSPLAGGYVGSASPSADQSGIGATMTDITGMSVTWTADPTRRYMTTMILTCYPSTGPASIVAQIANASGTLVRRAFTTVPTANYYADMVVVAVETGLSGPQTRKGQINVSAGTLTVYAATTTAIIIVEDVTTVSPGPYQSQTDPRTAAIPVLSVVNGSWMTLATIDFGTATYPRRLEIHGSFIGSSTAAALIRTLLAINGATAKQGQKSYAANATESQSLDDAWTYPAGPLLVEFKAQNMLVGTFTTVNDSSFSKLNVIASPG